MKIDPATGKYTVYKIPPQPGEKLGGLLAGRLHDFPKHETYQGIHSLAESPKDRHIFITPSYQRRLIEFDPVTKAFRLHEMDGGFYPHTIRFDAKDRAGSRWRCPTRSACSIAPTQKFTLYDLPFRTFMEKVTVKLTPFIFKLLGWGIPVANYVKVDKVSTGVPLPYGIDITPDGKAWVARMHTDELASVDPATGVVTMIKTPFRAPRRLRSDRDGNLWIVAFNESKIARYAPKTGQFTLFDLPVSPKGSDTPYSLNVDRERHQVWVNGTNSDSVYRYDIATQAWTHVPDAAPRDLHPRRGDLAKRQGLREQRFVPELAHRGCAADADRDHPAVNDAHPHARLLPVFPAGLHRRAHGQLHRHPVPAGEGRLRSAVGHRLRAVVRHLHHFWLVCRRAVRPHLARRG